MDGSLSWSTTEWTVEWHTSFRWWSGQGHTNIVQQDTLAITPQWLCYPQG